jgi:hypothetical protein
MTRHYNYGKFAHKPVIHGICDLRADVATICESNLFAEYLNIRAKRRKRWRWGSTCTESQLFSFQIKTLQNTFRLTSLNDTSESPTFVGILSISEPVFDDPSLTPAELGFESADIGYPSRKAVALVVYFYLGSN